MSPTLRKVALTSHVTSSVGWLGAVLVYLTLAVSATRGGDLVDVRAAYRAMDAIGWTVLVPLSLAALATGLVQGLGTDWGLFRYWWVATKLMLTVAATLVLVRYMSTVSGLLPTTDWSTVDGAASRLRIQPLVHAGGGLLVLVVTTALSVFKPWGRTPHGRRHAFRVSPDSAMPTVPSTWRNYLWLGLIALFLLLLAMHLAGGRMPHH